MVWQTAHCCLNSVAPSGGFAGGGVNCAAAWSTASAAAQMPARSAVPRVVSCTSPLARVDLSRAVVVVGCRAEQSAASRSR